MKINKLLLFLAVFFSGALWAQNTVTLCNTNLEFNSKVKIESDDKKIDVQGENFRVDIFYLNHWENIQTPVTAYIDFIEIDNFDFVKKMSRLVIGDLEFDCYVLTLPDGKEFKYRVISFGECGGNKFLLDIASKVDPMKEGLPKDLASKMKFK